MDAERGRNQTDINIDIEFSDHQNHLRVDHEALGDLACRVLAREGVLKASVSIALVDDATIHDLNRLHLGHDWPTDVITFPLSDPGDPLLAGELIVSTEMAATTARGADLDPLAELALYVVHGVLHLCGLDDQNALDKAAMRLREAEHLAAFGWPNTYPLVEPTEPEPQRRECATCPD
ncbi:MAG: rRNA maturation RNase YbeY [Isosphaeraceae bacterium]